MTTYPTFPCTSPAPRLPSFFLGGFECSTLINSRGVYLDQLRLTRHDKQVAEDYRLLRRHGIRAARDGIRWNVVDNGGKLDFASALPFIHAARSEQMTILWDLFHYGYPQDLDPFTPEFVTRFAVYCQAFARLLMRQGYGEQSGARYYTPVNEISFFAWAGGEVGWFAPHTHGCGPELKRALAQAALAGIDAILAVDPLARFVHCDPLVYVHAPCDAPHLEDQARHFNSCCVFEAWDMLAGRLAPELGGSPRHLDIVGINYYGVNQWEHCRPDSIVTLDDPRCVPFSQLLRDVHQRYEAPLIVTETSATGEGRAAWFEHIASECRLAQRQGIPVQGLCLYPALGMYDWHALHYHPMGLWDITPCGYRFPHKPTLSLLRRWESLLNPPPSPPRRLLKRNAPVPISTRPR
jgi:hypothetical protein